MPRDEELLPQASPAVATLGPGAGRALLTLWGTSWDGIARYPHKYMKIPLYSAPISLTPLEC